MTIVRVVVLVAFLAAMAAVPVRAGEPTPTAGIASHYGPGTGVATQWCTWVRRHAQGCGWLAIQSHDTGIVVVAPVVDWCQCYRGTADERLVDLQWGVVDALGLDRAQGLYPVSTWPIDPAETSGLPPSPVVSDEARASGASVPALPDTAVEPAEERDDTR